MNETSKIGPDLCSFKSTPRPRLAGGLPFFSHSLPSFDVLPSKILLTKPILLLLFKALMFQSLLKSGNLTALAFLTFIQALEGGMASKEMDKRSHLGLGFR